MARRQAAQSEGRGARGGGAMKIRCGRRVCAGAAGAGARAAAAAAVRCIIAGDARCKMGRCAMDGGCWRRVGRGSSCWRRQEASTRSWSSSGEGLDARAPPQGPPTPLALAPLTILIARRRPTEPERPAARSPQCPASERPEPRRSHRLSPLAPHLSSSPPPLPASPPLAPSPPPLLLQGGRKVRAGPRRRA